MKAGATTPRKPAWPAKAPAAKRTVKREYNVQSLLIGMRLIEVLVRSGGQRGVTELARDLGMTKWRVFRYLQTLASEGYVVQDPATERYEVGSRLYVLRDALPERFSFIRQAREEMHRLRQKLGHTVVLAGLLDERGVTVLEAVVGTQNVQFVLKVGATFDLHAAAHGKVALAFGEPDLLERTVARGLVRHTSRTITDSAQLRREIDKVRRQGWATAAEESFMGVNALVAPVLSPAGRFEAGLGIFGSVDQIPGDPPPALVRATVEAARRLSQRLDGAR